MSTSAPFFFACFQFFHVSKLTYRSSGLLVQSRTIIQIRFTLDLRGKIAAQKHSPRCELRHSFALFFVEKCRSFSWFVPFVRTSVWTSSPSSRKFSGRFRACETFAAPFAACCGRYRVFAALSPSP